MQGNTAVGIDRHQGVQTCPCAMWLPWSAMTLAFVPFLFPCGGQEVQKNMPTRIATMQPHCSSMIRSRSTSAAKASVTSG